MTKLYELIARCVEAEHNCVLSDNLEWQGRHRETIANLVREHMPSGSGIDCGTTFNWDKSSGYKLVFGTSYHHMNDGMYDGWTEHEVIVTPALSGRFDLRITGRDRRDIKDYLGEVYRDALLADISDQQYRLACGVAGAALGE